MEKLIDLYNIMGINAHKTPVMVNKSSNLVVLYTFRLIDFREVLVKPLSHGESLVTKRTT